MLPLFDDGFITLKEDTHQYFDINGQEYNSVSSVLSSVEEPFPEAQIARNMTSNQKEADALKAEWKAKNMRSITWGNMIHGECENFVKYGSVKDSQFKKLEDELHKKLTKRYARNHAERILRDQGRLICGTGDHLGERSKSRGQNQVIDVNDFKTNLSKGIRNESAKIDEQSRAILKYYNKYLLHPLEHLEASSYVKYCLQLSIYGLMLEMYGAKVGSLNIYYIDVDLNVNEIFVPYMRTDAITLLNNFVTLVKPSGEPLSHYGKMIKKNKAKDEEASIWL
jgi:hypothetical protein